MTNMSNSIRTLLVGFGLSGKFIHYPLLKMNKNFEITGVVKRNFTNEELIFSKNSNFELYDSVQSALKSNDLYDLVILATPNSTHESYAKLFLSAGIDVVIEKPLAGTEEQVRNLFEFAEGLSRKIFPFHNRRWDSDFLTAKKLVVENLIGNITSIESYWENEKEARDTWRNSSDPKKLGGITLDIGVHLIDQIVQILGPIKQLNSTIKTLRKNAQADDFMKVVSYHTNGVKSELTASHSVANRNPRFILNMKNSQIILKDYDSQEKSLKIQIMLSQALSERVYHNPKAKITIQDKNDSLTKFINYEIGNWQQFYNHVFRNIRHDVEFPIKAAEVIYTHKLIDAVVFSSKYNCSVSL